MQVKPHKQVKFDPKDAIIHFVDMSKEEEVKPLVSKPGIIFDLVLAIAFFFFMRNVLVPHVPSQDPLAVNIVSSMTSFCMTGVFWIATNMLRVTWVDYSRRQKK
jgi:hypothetical protein